MLKISKIFFQPKYELILCFLESELYSRKLGSLVTLPSKNFKLLNAVWPKSPAKCCNELRKPPKGKVNIDYSILLYVVKCNRNNCPLLYLKFDRVFSKASHEKKLWKIE